MPGGITVVTSLLIFGGGFLLRASWIRAGRISADTPEATHYYNALEERKERRLEL